MIWFSSAKGSSGKQAILLHGFGANGKDLIGLSSYLDPESYYTWHFPQAPFLLSPGSFAWFPKTPAQQQAALNGSLFTHLENWDDPSIDESLQLLEKEMAIRGIAATTTVFGGFSQGSMMALLLGLHHAQTAQSILLFSSSLFAKQRLEHLTTKHHVPVFMSHGNLDPVLPIHGARNLRSMLTEKNMEIFWHEFSGSHEIEDSCLYEASNFIASQRG